MQVIWAERALVGDTWRSHVRLTLRDGRIDSLAADSPREGTITNLLVPAPANCHSHAFQRAMAGLTEKRGPEADSFWTWRALMYRFLDALTPEQVEAIAAFVQMEMLEAGFGASVEFHYLHHQPGGAPYARLAEMAERVCAAAETSGIGLTLLPVHYQYGGLDRRALGPGQVRFGNDLDRFARLHEEAGASLAALPADAVLGLAPHSLRAVAAADLPALEALAQGSPIHMHLAEQAAEVAEVEAALGARPVAWALDNLPLDRRWCLVHCTQMQAHETCALAATGAVAGLCPLTEANLGDGIFDGVRWLGAGGALAIGSDSNIRISLAGELRQLDTSQRLRDHSRAALATLDRSAGRRLMQDAAAGGAQAAGRGSGRIEVGAWGDLLALDTDHPDLAGLGGDTALDSFVFAGGNDLIADVWSAGRHLVTRGRHTRRDEITRAYRPAVAPLRDAL
ncbi:Formiminoglutamate deiminase [Oceanicola granulosus HTCC2516]|uniref:Formiminoglutamate deiminase n=1 Tax=Oceanicola granulosus (strain ATCC BAA-861 / DSM 15982 / KCTC 12143 / HTCC2516) TaxID=314256 RepID=Q2CIA4_OCEGH|nr:formimidoylglutamate deiminase [Oceanicola granulosus]EAR52354.1 Formiminoglutamate deiminase [Oceanicola granulosus HTCC2516]